MNVVRNKYASQNEAFFALTEQVAADVVIMRQRYKQRAINVKHFGFEREKIEKSLKQTQRQREQRHTPEGGQ
uniref:AAA_lid_6 domain-containing protein n=1 Tax=Syphacia muris TaxID=451379 RepID=A0A158R5Z4_9BILA